MFNNNQRKRGHRFERGEREAKESMLRKVLEAGKVRDRKCCSYILMSKIKNKNFFKTSNNFNVACVVVGMICIDLGSNNILSSSILQA